MDAAVLDERLWSRNYGDAMEEELEAMEEEFVEVPEVLVNWKRGVQVRESDLLIVAVDERAAIATSTVLTTTSSSSDNNNNQQQQQSFELVGSIMFPDQPIQAAYVPGAGRASDIAVESYGRTTMYAKSKDDLSVVVVLVRQVLAAERAAKWVSALLDAVKAKRTVVLDSMLQSHFQTIDRETSVPPLLRCMLTRTSLQRRREAKKNGDAEKVRLCKLLDAPNIVSGVAAAVISRCEIFGLDAELYVSVANHHYPYESLQAFERVFKDLDLLPGFFQTDDDDVKRPAYMRALSCSLGDPAASKTRGGHAAPGSVFL